MFKPNKPIAQTNSLSSSQNFPPISGSQLPSHDTEQTTSYNTQYQANTEDVQTFSYMHALAYLSPFEQARTAGTALVFSTTQKKITETALKKFTLTDAEGKELNKVDKGNVRKIFSLLQEEKYSLPRLSTDELNRLFNSGISISTEQQELFTALRERYRLLSQDETNRKKHLGDLSLNQIKILFEKNLLDKYLLELAQQPETARIIRHTPYLWKHIPEQEHTIYYRPSQIAKMSGAMLSCLFAFIGAPILMMLHLAARLLRSTMDIVASLLILVLTIAICVITLGWYANYADSLFSKTRFRKSISLLCDPISFGLTFLGMIFIAPYKGFTEGYRRGMTRDMFSLIWALAYEIPIVTYSKDYRYVTYIAGTHFRYSPYKDRYGILAHYPMREEKEDYVVWTISTPVYEEYKEYTPPLKPLTVAEYAIQGELANPKEHRRMISERAKEATLPTSSLDTKDMNKGHAHVGNPSHYDLITSQYSAIAENAVTGYNSDIQPPSNASNHPAPQYPIPNSPALLNIR